MCRVCVCQPSHLLQHMAAIITSGEDHSSVPACCDPVEADGAVCNLKRRPKLIWEKKVTFIIVKRKSSSESVLLWQLCLEWGLQFVTTFEAADLPSAQHLPKTQGRGPLPNPFYSHGRQPQIAGTALPSHAGILQHGGKRGSVRCPDCRRQLPPSKRCQAMV